jgi:Mlc titration factor MtfA (ptsG expression regulator)
MVIILFVLSLVFVTILIYSFLKKKPLLAQPSAQTEKDILAKHVLFYQVLSAEEKLRFEGNLRAFLQMVKITGVKTPIEDIDRVFIAAAAIIPIFAFKEWQYRNIHEVLLYPGSFNEDYEITGNERNVLGMVGNGPMQNEMILSKDDLRNGFLNHSDKSNTAIHEFVHLIDKSDGDADGVPNVLLKHKYVIPWLKQIHKEIAAINQRTSDINPYGATNEAEFFAVAAEYFFEQPHALELKHPELYKLLEEVFLKRAV